MAEETTPISVAEREGFSADRPASPCGGSPQGPAGKSG